MNYLNNILAAVVEGYGVYQVIGYILLGVMALCSLFVIVVVLMQQGQSNGLGALGGTTDTFYGKNKGKSIESKLKKITAIVLIVMAIISVVYFIVVVHLGNL